MNTDRMAGTEFNLSTFFSREFEEHAAVLQHTRDGLKQDFRDLVGACATAIRQGHKILFFGNGGSAADAQNFATELCVRYKQDRKAISALALTTDSSVLTATGNDFGFEHIFSRQIEALGRQGDVAIGISTSGRSANVILALKKAREMKLVTAALSGRDAGDLPPLVDHCLVVPSNSTARIQEMHILLGQMLCGALEIKLGLVADSHE